MNIKKHLILLFTFILFGIPSCRVSSVSRTPPIITTPIIESQYADYIPSKEFNIHIEFKYPSNWILIDGIDDIGFVTISLGDPQYLTLPTNTVDTLHPIPSDLGNVNILIVPSEYSQTPESQIDLLKQGYSNINRITILRDYQIEIDRHIASVFEYLTDDKETSPSIMFNKRIYFMVEDKLYEIYLSVAEKDRGKEFEKGFDYLLNSIKIVP